MKSVDPLDDLIVCPFCDDVSQRIPLKAGHKALCACCGEALYERRKNTIERTLAISIGGLLLIIPVLILPIIGVGIAGNYNEASLIDCIVLMINNKFYVIAFSVFMFTIALPVVKLFSLFYISFALFTDNITPSLLKFFRSYHQLESWAMVHVFFLGVVISMYKLFELADLTVGVGLISLLMLLLCSTLVSVTLDHHYVWHKMEQAVNA
ncbi:paraquat-inducible protein A [Colwellia sp. MEBiC06753]